MRKLLLAVVVLSGLSFFTSCSTSESDEIVPISTTTSDTGQNQEDECKGNCSGTGG